MGRVLPGRVWPPANTHKPACGPGCTPSAHPHMCKTANYSLSQIGAEEEVVFPLGSAPAVAEAGPEIEGEEAEEEAEVPRKAREPGEPTDEERRRHDTTHLPFWSWCPYCVRGRMANPPHRDLGPSGRLGVPEVVMDY